MCGRFTLTVDSLEFRLKRSKRLNVKPVRRSVVQAAVQARFNIAPTQLHPIILADGEAFAAQPARWGLVNAWARDAKQAARQINARAETVADSRAYARPFRRQRCLVPADGWYEWSGPKQQRQPHWIHRADREPFVFAGLYDIWHPEPDRPAVTFTILTTEATDALASIHARMPVVMPPERQEAWLDAGQPGGRRRPPPARPPARRRLRRAPRLHPRQRRPPRRSLPPADRTAGRARPRLIHE